MTAFGKYYIDSMLFNLGFSIIIGAYAGPLWGLIIYGTIGTLVGVMAFSYFKEKEYYFYYNLGYTRNRLILQAALLNAIILLLGIGITGLFTLLV